MQNYIPGLCCDCIHGDFCGDYDENTSCPYRKEDGSCWKSPETPETEKPRLCCLLGVEVGERFKIDYPHRAISYLTVAENGVVWSHEENGGKHKVGLNTLYYILENPGKIIRPSRFSEKDRQAACALSAILGVSYIGRKDNGDLIASRFLGGPGVSVCQEYFSALLPGQSVRLSAIAGEQTERRDV